MIAKSISMAGLLLALSSLTGCDLLGSHEASSDPAMSKEAIATREALPEDTFEGVLAGKPTFLVLHECELYQVERLANGGVRWESVLAPDPYPFFTVCQRQSMTERKGELTVKLGRMAVGAGGCCATGGTYRSTDGRQWKKIS